MDKEKKINLDEEDDKLYTDMMCIPICFLVKYLVQQHSIHDRSACAVVRELSTIIARTRTFRLGTSRCEQGRKESG